MSGAIQRAWAKKLQEVKKRIKQEERKKRKANPAAAEEEEKQLLNYTQHKRSKKNNHEFDSSYMSYRVGNAVELILANVLENSIQSAIRKDREQVQIIETFDEFVEILKDILDCWVERQNMGEEAAESKKWKADVRETAQKVLRYHAFKLWEKYREATETLHRKDLVCCNDHDEGDEVEVSMEMINACTDQKAKIELFRRCLTSNGVEQVMLSSIEKISSYDTDFFALASEAIEMCLSEFDLIWMLSLESLKKLREREIPDSFDMYTILLLKQLNNLGEQALKNGRPRSEVFSFKKDLNQVLNSLDSKWRLPVHLLKSFKKLDARVSTISSLVRSDKISKRDVLEL